SHQYATQWLGMAFLSRRNQLCLSTLRLDPTHALEAELAAKASMPRRVVSNGWTVRLIHHNRRVIILGKDMTPLSRPARLLIAITFECQLIFHTRLPLQLDT